MNNDADTRGLILGLLYTHGVGGVVVCPNSFEPPMERQDIFKVGAYLHDDRIIRSFPSDTGAGYFMQISLRGQAIWEGKAESMLEISIPN